MALKKFKAITPSRRFLTVADFSDLTDIAPLKRALRGRRSNTGGRNHHGRVTAINSGGGHKRRYREIDFKRDKLNVPGKVVALEYDPNRTARIARINYVDGDKRYILAPQGLVIGQTILAGEQAEIKPGNALPLKLIPTGEAIHNIELKRGAGGKLVKSAGVLAQLAAKEGEYALVRLPSGEMRKVHSECYASIGVVSNPDHQNITLGKAGRARWLNIRPHVRGVAKNPVDHPMGGGEGKTSGGRHPCSRNALKAKGQKTRKNKRTNKFIVRRRK